MAKNTKFKQLSPYFIVILSLLSIIFTGAFLLVLPYANKNGQWGDFLSCLFTSTSATCVTGLSVYNQGIANQFNLFGQIVILIEIQVGGLGFVTILTFVISIFIRKLKFRDRLFLSRAINSTTIAQVGKFALRVVIIVLTVEISGFLLGLPVFLEMAKSVENMTPGEAVWMSLFTSISAFNNAGFDLFGGTSLIQNVGNVYIDALPPWLYYYFLSYIMLLIIIGGISFVVIIAFTFEHKKLRQVNAFTKVSLLMTTILIVGGFIFISLAELTRIQEDPSFLFHTLFQTITTRTAGFASTNQNDLTPATKAISDILMFIGGSPVSTAGGIKTTTFFIFALVFVRFLECRETEAFRRKIATIPIVKAISLIFLVFVLLTLSFFVVSSLERGKSELMTTDNIFLELFSAIGTVGLSAGITSSLSVGSKLVIIILMFVGRAGPITLFQIFERGMETRKVKHYKNIETEILIG